MPITPADLKHFAGIDTKDIVKSIVYVTYLLGNWRNAKATPPFFTLWLKDVEEVEKRAPFLHTPRMVKEQKELWFYLMHQYKNPVWVEIEDPKLGIVGSYASVLKPPSGSKGVIFFIPGIGNDYECVGPLIVSLAEAGYTVITISYPEGVHGFLTGEFARLSLEEKNGYTHAWYFAQCIGSIASRLNINEYSLWGFSTGALITALLWKHALHYGRVKDILLLAPAGMHKQSEEEALQGAIGELQELLKPELFALMQALPSLMSAKTPRFFAEKSTAYESLKRLVLEDSMPLYLALPSITRIVHLKNDHITKSVNASPQLCAFEQWVIPALHAGVHLQGRRIVSELISRKALR